MLIEEKLSVLEAQIEKLTFEIKYPNGKNSFYFRFEDGWYGPYEGPKEGLTAAYAKNILSRVPIRSRCMHKRPFNGDYQEALNTLLGGNRIDED